MPKPFDQNKPHKPLHKPPHKPYRPAHRQAPDSVSEFGGPSHTAREALNRQVSQLESIAGDESAPRPERLRAMELLAAIAGLRLGSSVREQLSGPESRPEPRHEPRPSHGPRQHRPAGDGGHDHGHGPPRRPKHDRPGEDRHHSKGVRNRGAAKFAKDGDGTREPRRLNTGARPPLPSGRPLRRLPPGE